MTKPAPNVSRESAAYLLQITQGMTIPVDRGEESVRSMHLAVTARRELQDIVDAEGTD